MLNYRSIVTNSLYQSGIPASLQYTDSESFFIQDITGDYDAANLGGWGVPNIARTDVLTFNIVLYNWTENKVYYPTPPTTATLNIVSSYPISSSYEVTLSNMTGGQQTGAFNDGVYQLFGSTIVVGTPSTPLVTLALAIQVRSIVAYMRKLSDKIAYGKPSCKELSKYDLLTRTFGELINEIEIKNNYLKSISLLDNNFSKLAFGKDVYTTAVNLYNKCAALTNEGGDCGC